MLNSVCYSKPHYSISPGLSQSYKAIAHPKVLIRDVKSSNLYWNGFSVSDYSSKLNNRLQTRNGTFNFFVDEMLPRLKRKHYIASFSLCMFEHIENILPPPLKFSTRHPIMPCLGQFEKWTKRVFFSLCVEDDEEITCWKQKTEQFLNHLLLAPLTRKRWWIESYYLFY